jgi:hypothetical protein
MPMDECRFAEVIGKAYFEALALGEGQPRPPLSVDKSEDLGRTLVDFDRAGDGFELARCRLSDHAWPDHLAEASMGGESGEKRCRGAAGNGGFEEITTTHCFVARVLRDLRRISGGRP